MTRIGTCYAFLGVFSPCCMNMKNIDLNRMGRMFETNAVSYKSQLGPTKSRYFVDDTFER